MGLFKKDPCCLCGGKTGLLDKKCIDGKVCKECRSKLSVWFDDYKNTDKLHLQGQIEVRKMYADMVKVMRFNKIFGEHGVILIDEEKRTFVAFPDTSSGLFGSQRQVKSIDDVIDLGPESGDKGGNIVAVGTPEEIAKHPESYTGQFLREKLAN